MYSMNDINTINISSNDHLLIQYIIFNDITNLQTDIINKLIIKCDKQEYKQYLVNLIYKVAIRLDHLNICQLLIEQKLFPSVDTFFWIILHNNISVINSLIDTNYNFAECHNGLLPIEYALQLHSINPVFYKIIVSLNKFTYIRNPKWWNWFLNLSVYNERINNEFEKLLYHKIKSYVAPVKTIIDLNSLIIQTYIELQKYIDVIVFIKHTSSYIDWHFLMKYLQTTKNISALLKLKLYIPFSFELILTYMDLHLYENVLFLIKKKKPIDYAKLICHLLDNMDIQGLMFIFDYVDKKYISYTDDNGNTLLHLLCMSHVNNDSQKLNSCLQILDHYIPSLIDVENKEGNTPIFMACHNTEIFEQILIKGNDVSIQHINKKGDQLIHHIIRNGTMDVLQKFLYYHHDTIDTLNVEKDTPLLLAIKLKKIDMCNILILNGASINHADTHGNTLGHYISMYGITGINIPSIQHTQNKYGKSPLDYMIQNIYKCVQ